MALTRRSGRSRFTLVLLVLVSLTLLTFSYRDVGPVKSAREGVTTVLGPVGDAASKVWQPVTNAWGAIFDQGDLARQNEKLRAQVADLQGQLDQGKIAAQSLEEMLKSLDTPYVGSIKTVDATVTSGPAGNFDRTIEIQRGSKDGVAVGMPVVAGFGLVGQVKSVTSDRAVVQLVTDPAFKVGFTIIGTVANGVASGTGNPDQLAGTVRLEANPQAGQFVVTLGESGSPFPPNLPIGRVDAVHQDQGANAKTIDINLSAQTRDLKYVKVVLYQPQPLTGSATP